MIYEDVVSKIQGIVGFMWSKRQQEYMFELGKTTTLAAEIGSWKGLSAAIVGLGMLEGNNRGKYYCIDTFKSEPVDGSFGSGVGAYISCEDTLEIFNQMINKLNLQDIIIPMMGYSYDIKIWSQTSNNLDFIYIDGDHQTISVLQDTILYVPKLKSEGLILYHDHGYGTIKDAIKQAMELNLISFIDAFDDFGIYKTNLK